MTDSKANTAATATAAAVTKPNDYQLFHLFDWKTEDEEKKDLLLLLKCFEGAGKKILKPVTMKSKLKDVRDEFKMQMTILKYENNA